MSSYLGIRLRRIRRLRALAALARMKGISRRGNSIPFGRCALQALKPAWIPVRQIEAGRRAIKRCVRRWAKIWVLPDEKPVTISNTETHIDYSDKGDPIYIIRTYWVCLIQPNDILYEISGVSETIARRALARAAYRMPIQTEFINVISQF